MGQDQTRQLHHHPHPEDNMKKYATTWLLILSIIIAESHSYISEIPYLPKDFATRKENWILTVDRTMEIQWNVKYLSNEINAILFFIAMLFYNKRWGNKTTVITFIALCFIDLGMYFHNYKTLHYGSVYVWTAAIWILVFFSRTLSEKTLSLWVIFKCKSVLLCQRIQTIIKKK